MDPVPSVSNKLEYPVSPSGSAHSPREGYRQGVTLQGQGEAGRRWSEWTKCERSGIRTISSLDMLVLPLEYLRRISQRAEAPAPLQPTS